MSSTGENKPAGKSGRRNKKGGPRRQKSASPQSPAAVQTQNPEPEQERVPQVELQPAASEPLEAAVTEAVIAEPVIAEPVVAEPTVAERIDAKVEAVVAADAPSPAEPATAEPAPTEAAPTEAAPVSLQTIANAYRDYTKKSFAEFGSFCEQLSGVRSLDKVVEVQTEFVKRAYENSVAESQKIRELHRKLARQTFEPFENLVGNTPETHDKS
jgi:hypothetical protein